LDRRSALKAQYAAFIKEYLDFGHMSLVSAADAICNASCGGIPLRENCGWLG